MEEKTLISFEKYWGEVSPLVVKREYENIVYNVTPDRFITEGKAVEDILYTLSALRTFPVKIENDSGKVLYIDSNLPVHYEILYKNKNINFNYVVPEKYEDAIINTIKKVYRQASVKKIPDYFNNFKDSYVCHFKQKKHFVYSLDVDYRENVLIEGLLNIVKNLKEDDMVLLQFSILPLSETWKNKWEAAYRKIREGEELLADESVGNLIAKGILKLEGCLISIFESLLNTDNTSSYSKHGDYYNKVPLSYDYRSPYYGRRTTTYNSKIKQLNKYSESNLYDGRPTRPYIPSYRGSYDGSYGGYSMYANLSHNTLSKVAQDGFEMQIRMYCNSKQNAYYYANLFSGVFKTIAGDNELQQTKITYKKGMDRSLDFMMSKPIYSTREVAMFLQLPNRRLQLDFKNNIKVIENIEVPIPKELRIKGIPLGTSSYRGEKIPVYWPTFDKHMAPMHKVITGLQRTGKSSYLANFAIEAIKVGHSVFIIDTIKNCDLANEVRDYLPKEYEDKLIILDFSNLDYLLPLAWNEIDPSQGNDNREKLKRASMIAGNYAKFLETAGELKGENQKLTPKMLRYLSSACKIVLSLPNTTLLDVIDCLVYVDKRHEFIRKSGFSSNTRAVQDLLSLDDYDKEGNLIGTKLKEITGIVDRASILFNDYMLELLLSTPNNGKLDFKKWADEGKCVLIKLSERDFNRESLKTIVTLLYSKIWLSMLARGEGSSHRLTHVILDEVHNFPQVCEMLKGNCREAAKYGLSYVFTSHLLKDLKGLLPYIKGSGANFMLFKTTKENFILMEEELLAGGYSIEDCLTIKDFHTINIVNYDRDYVVFTSKVIDPAKSRFQYYDRSSLDLKHSKALGVYYEDI